MQQQYVNGMVPMMMPIMDPRMMPMMDPRLMPQAPMMMDPRMLISSTSPPPTPAPTRSRHSQQYDNQSVGSNRIKSKRHVSSSPSISHSINSATTTSRYAPSTRRTRNN